jgi:hypothetical protein
MNHCFARRSNRNFGISAHAIYPHPLPAGPRLRLAAQGIDNLTLAGAAFRWCPCLAPNAIRLRMTTVGRSRSRSARCAKWACAASCSIATAGIMSRSGYWPDDMRLSDLEPRFVCQGCGSRGADVRPDFERGDQRFAIIGSRARQQERRWDLPVYPEWPARQTSSMKRAVMSERAAKPGRFLVRMGGDGWMVYDRDRQGPALIGSKWATNLTKEQAERAYESIAFSAHEPERLGNGRGRPA